MKKKIFFLLSLIFISLSCNKDRMSHTYTKLDNPTNHLVEIIPYENGAMVNEDRIIIGPFESKIVFEENVWGKTLSPCWGTLLQPYDSVKVVFDNGKKSLHLRFTDSVTTSDYVTPYRSNRNITNEESYQKTIIEEEKKYMSGYFTYTFTGQDYLDAKD